MSPLSQSFPFFRKTFRIHFLRTTISVLAFFLFPAKQSVKASAAHYQRISSILDLLYLLYHLPKKTCNSQNQKAPLSACTTTINPSKQTVLRNEHYYNPQVPKKFSYKVPTTTVHLPSTVYTIFFSRRRVKSFQSKKKERKMCWEMNLGE